MNTKTDSQTENKALLSADVVGSTALYDALEDSDARELVDAALEVARHACREHDGVVVAEVGDQIVALFEDASAATSAASDIHMQLHEQTDDTGDRGLRMRVGLHYGPIPVEGDPLAGESNKVVNWAGANAKAEQTLATRVFIDQLPRIFRALSRFVDDETFNFISIEHVELFEIIWDVEAITAYSGEAPVRKDQTLARVVFGFGDAEVQLDADHPVISIGRASQNDLVVKSDLVSRQHLSAQFSRGRCTITDNSTNGSVVQTESGERFEIKRESFRLYGSGTIVPGKPDEGEVTASIKFRCE